MPFAEEFNGIWREVIHRTVTDSGHICVRDDEIFTPGNIVEQIHAEIKASDYYIADLSMINANVYYEVGYAQALEKPGILICEKSVNVPFDVSHRRMVKYQNTIAGAAELRERLKSFINNLKNPGV